MKRRVKKKIIGDEETLVRKAVEREMALIRSGKMKTIPLDEVKRRLNIK